MPTRPVIRRLVPECRVGTSVPAVFTFPAPTLTLALSLEGRGNTRADLKVGPYEGDSSRAPYLKGRAPEPAPFTVSGDAAYFFTGGVNFHRSVSVPTLPNTLVSSSGKKTLLASPWEISLRVSM